MHYIIFYVSPPKINNQCVECVFFLDKGIHHYDPWTLHKKCHEHHNAELFMTHADAPSFFTCFTYGALTSYWLDQVQPSAIYFCSIKSVRFSCATDLEIIYEFQEREPTLEEWPDMFRTLFCCSMSHNCWREQQKKETCSRIGLEIRYLCS